MTTGYEFPGNPTQWSLLVRFSTPIWGTLDLHNWGSQGSGGPGTGLVLFSVKRPTRR